MRWIVHLTGRSVLKDNSFVVSDLQIFYENASILIEQNILHLLETYEVRDGRIQPVPVCFMMLCSFFFMDGPELFCRRDTLGLIRFELVN